MPPSSSLLMLYRPFRFVWLLPYFFFVPRSGGLSECRLLRSAIEHHINWNVCQRGLRSKEIALAVFVIRDEQSSRTLVRRDIPALDYAHEIRYCRAVIVSFFFFGLVLTIRNVDS